MRCWGDDTNGQVTVPGDLGAVSRISAGGSHTCALLVAGNAMRCWGANGYLQATVPAYADAEPPPGAPNLYLPYMARP